MAQPAAYQELPCYGLSPQAVREKEDAAGEVQQGVAVEAPEDHPLVKRVENLVWIKRNTCYKEALKDWEQQKKSLGGKLERREKRVEELTNQVYNVVGFFSVFQGVILTAVTQLNSQSSPGTSIRPLCGKVWYPLTLSLLAAIAAIIGIWLKFRDLWSTDKSIQSFKLRLRVCLFSLPFLVCHNMDYATDTYMILR
jgi:hypothetical protein